MKKLIILHGWTYSTHQWNKLIALLAGRGVKIELLKIPGLTEATNRVWTLNDYVNWLKNILDQETEPIILLGHSNGGRIAIAFAAQYPEKIERLILLNSAGIYHRDWPTRFKRFIFGNLARLGKKLTSSNRLRKLLYRLARTRDYQNASPLMRQTMINLIETDLRDKLEQIKAPTSIIWSEKDKETPLPDGQLMHQLIPQSKLHIIKGAGHSPQASNPEEVSRIVTQNINPHQNHADI